MFFKPKPQVYLYSNNTFYVNKLFNLQLLTWYLGDLYSGLYHRESRAIVTVGIEKDFFKSALKINFTANDIFNQYFNSGDYNVGQTNIYYHRTYSSNYFKLTATYNFGSLKKSTYKNKTTSQSENNRVN